MAKILIENKKQSIILTLLVFTILFFLTVIPFIFYTYFYHTDTYNFLINYNYWVYILFISSFYLIYHGIYNYKIKFDNYSLLIQSRRTLSSWFGSKVYNLEISNDMLVGFSFSRSFLSINYKLLIKMKSNTARKSYSVKIPLTLLGRKRKERLKWILNNIIQNN